MTLTFYKSIVQMWAFAISQYKSTSVLWIINQMNLLTLVIVKQNT